jgi:hypothetical protein
MKARRVLLWLALSLYVTYQGWLIWPEVTNRIGGIMTPNRPMEAVFEEAVEFSRKELDLVPLECDPETTLRIPDLHQRCFATKLRAEEFGGRVEAHVGTELSPLTGWRDSFGSLSAGFVFRKQDRYDLGLSYKRRDSGIMAPTYQRLEGYEGMVRVMMSRRD